MADRNLDIALRIKADLKDAKAQVDAINQSVADTAKAADTGKAGLGRLGQQLDALVANTSQAVQLLQGMDARMADLAQRSIQVAQATTQVEAGTRAAAEGIKAVGESESEAAARIREVIAASREQAAAEQAATAAAKDADTSAQQRATTAQDTAAILQRQNAQMRQSSIAVAEMGAAERQATASTEDQTAALANLLGQIDPTIAALDRLDQQEAELARFHKAGLLDAEDFQQFRAQIENSRAAIGRMGVSAGQTAQAMRQLPAQITDITTSIAAGMPVWMVFLQQGGQIRDSFGGFGNAIRGVMSLITPARVLLGGMAAAVTALAVAAIQGQREEQKLNQELIATGNYAGTSTGEIRALANELGDSSDQTGVYRQALEQLSASGRITHDRLTEAAQGAVDFATVSGANIDKAVATFVRLQDDPVAAIKELDKQYHVLTLAEYENIQALQAQGDADAAAAIAQTAAAQAFADRAADMREHMGTLERSWGSLKEAASRAWDAMKGVGRDTTAAEDLASIRDQIDRTKNELVDVGGLSPDQAEATAQVQALRAKENVAKLAATWDSWVAGRKAIEQKMSDDAKRGSDTMARYLQAAKADSAKAQEIAKVHAATAALIKENPNNRAQYEADEKVALAGIEKRYATRTPKQADNQAAIDRAAATAQQALIDSLAQLQGELDPVAAAWVKYNQARAQADKQAATAKQARGANVEAIDAERNAVVQLAAKQREAAIAKVADQDNQAWEKLRDSLRTPIEVRLDKAADQIKQLNELMESGAHISNDEYQAALKRIGQASVGKLPTYQGVDASVGGVSSELAKNYQAQAALEQTYAEQSAALRAKFDTDDLAQHQAYLAAKAKLDQDYADQSRLIDQSRQQLTLQASSEFFGNLATLQNSSNSKMARVGKAAAIAQAVISTYQSATQAYAAMSGIPYIGPALGAAAAAAAIVAGLANVAQIRAQPVGGYADGGYTGPGGKYQVAGVVHAGEGVLSQRDMAALGGPAAFEAFRRGLHGYADGGFVSPLAGVPAPSLPVSPRAPALATVGAGRGDTKVTLHNHNYIDIDELRDRIMTGPKAEAHTVNHVLRNGRTVKQGIG